MMKLNKYLIVLALSCGLMALSATAQSSTPGTDQQSTPGSTASSAKVGSDVQSALQKDAQLAGTNIQVQANDKNQIELSGTVASTAQKDRAEQIATQSAPSGYSVMNKIEVSAGTGSKSENPK